jgi:hypothetical protein
VCVHMCVFICVYPIKSFNGSPFIQSWMHMHIYTLLHIKFNIMYILMYVCAYMCIYMCIPDIPENSISYIYVYIYIYMYVYIYSPDMLFSSLGVPIYSLISHMHTNLNAKSKILCIHVYVCMYFIYPSRPSGCP